MDAFHKSQEPLNDIQKKRIHDLKTQAEYLLSQYDFSVPKQERSERSRCMQMARSFLETSVMWAVKSLSTPQGNDEWMR